MIINLKQIQLIDSDNIKLDKINYNFDQLVVNGGGPKGYVGPDGNTGPQGFQGAVGALGERGYQGVQGPSSDPTSTTKYWEAVPQNIGSGNNVMATLFSKPPTAPTTGYGTIVSSGYISTDNSYDTQQSPGVGSPKYQWAVNRTSNKVASNLRFTSEGVTTGNAFDITMDNSGSLYKLYLGFIDNQSSQLNLQAESHIIRSSVNGNTLFDITSKAEVPLRGGSTYTNTFFGDSVTFNAALFVENSDADTNKIMTSISDSGDVTFKTAEELGGSVKVGTIVSILPSIFRDFSRFVNYQNIDTSLDLNNPLKIRMGAGIGDYSGWYVCNGEAWTNGSVTILVPDLNSFSYQIISNPMSLDPNSQGSVIKTNDEVQLIGGVPTEVVAHWDGGQYSQYSVNLTTNLTDPQISSFNSGNQFKIKKLPQIIYLGAGDLWWSQAGEGQQITSDYSNADYDIQDYNAS